MSSSKSRRSSIMASPSKRRTQRKHVTINQDKNEVVEFEKVPRTENEKLMGGPNGKRMPPPPGQGGAGFQPGQGPGGQAPGQGQPQPKK